MTPNQATANIATAKPAERYARQPSPLIGALRHAARRPEAVFGVVWLLIIVLITALSSFIAPHDPYKQDILNPFAPPGPVHWLGTDQLGRDLLSRIMFGGGELLWTSVEAVVLGVVLGVSLGMLAGYLGNWRDSAITFGMDVLMAIPGFVILIAVYVVTGNQLPIVMAALGILFSINFYRLARAGTMAARELAYVDAARVAGIPQRRTLVRHILPNITGPLLVQAFLQFGIALLIAASLSFLGLGGSPDTPSWGQMIYDATKYMSLDPWMMMPIGVVLILTILSANFIGGAIRDGLPHAQKLSLLAPMRKARATPDAAGVGAAADAPNPPLLDVESLVVSFPAPGGGDQPVVDGVDLQIWPGETVGLVGESGCGKTMTALSLIGLLPRPGRISGGRVSLDGVDLTSLSERALGKLRGRRIGLISQEPMVALDPCFSVASLLREPLRKHRGLSRRQADLEALDLLRLVGIADPERVARSYPHQISGGMAQRLGIALALAGQPDLLIADEPTTALDVTIQAEILDLLRSLQQQLGMAILLVTHDFGVVADMCDRVMVMYAGQVVEAGTADDILTRPAHPYSDRLLAGAPDRNLPGTPLATVPGTVPLPKDWPVSCRFADRCPLVTDACLETPIPLLPVGGHDVRCIHPVLSEPTLEVVSR